MQQKSMIAIKPKYQSFSSFKSENGSSLVELRQKLAAQTKLVRTLRGDYNQKEEKQKIQIETLDRDVIKVRTAIKELETEFNDQTKTLDNVLKAMPNPSTSICLEKVSDAVFSNSTKINDTDSYDNIKMEWELARDQYNGRKKKAADLSNTRTQIKNTQNRNMVARTAITEFGPDEFSRRISKETFERLCKVMKWEHRDFSTPKAVTKTAPMKRPLSSIASTQKSKRQPKVQKSMSFFNEDLISMDDDMF